MKSNQSNILLKFLSRDAIENCITCLNYDFDKVIFFCYKEIKNEEINNIKSFIIEECKTDCAFKTIESNDINYIKNILNSNINKYNKNYFDLTGCEGIFQVAMINIAYEKNIPMHIYDIKNDIAINVDDEIKGSIKEVKQRKIKLDIDKYIKMYGGIINDRMKNSNKNAINTAEYIKLKKIKQKYISIWNYFCACMQVCNKKNCHFYINDISIVLNNCKNKIDKEQLMEILDEMYNKGLILNYKHVNYGFSFDFINDNIKSDACDPGTILETQVYQHEKTNSEDCKIGIHLDWDGIITKEDVYNEIDVLRLDNNILTFISCKDTLKLEKEYLYELETVANRFGGKYCNKLLVCRNKPNKIYITRAESIGIKVKTIDELLEE